MKSGPVVWTEKLPAGSGPFVMRIFSAEMGQKQLCVTHSTLYGWTWTVGSFGMMLEFSRAPALSEAEAKREAEQAATA